MLEIHINMLTNAIVSSTYAVTITRVEALRHEVEAVKGEVAAMEQALVAHIGSLETRLENLLSHDRSASANADTAFLTERVAAAVAEEGAKIVELLGVHHARGADVTKSLFQEVVCKELLPKIQAEGKATREAVFGSKQDVLEKIELNFSAVAAVVEEEGMLTR